jgi:hypothetical protein
MNRRKHQPRREVASTGLLKASLSCVIESLARGISFGQPLTRVHDPDFPARSFGFRVILSR